MLYIEMLLPVGLRALLEMSGLRPGDLTALLGDHPAVLVYISQVKERSEDSYVPL